MNRASKYFNIQRLLNYPFRDHLWAYRQRYLIGLVALIGVDLINVCLPLLVREAVDALGPKNFSRVMWAGGLYLFLMGLQSWGRYLWRIYLIGTSHFVAQRLRLRLYDHLQRLPLSYYQKIPTGDLMSRATNDIESIRMALGPGVLVTVDAFLMFVFIVPVMFYLSPKLAMLTFAFYPLVPWLTTKLGDRIDTLFEALQSKMSNMSAHAQETFSAIRLIKSLVLESSNHRQFTHLSKAYEREGIELAKTQAIFSPALSVLTHLGTFLILLMGGIDVMNGLLTVGTFVAFQRFVVQLSWPMEAIGWAVTLNREGVAAHRRLREIMGSPQVESIRAANTKKRSPHGLVDIHHLNYEYPVEAANQNHFRLALSDLRIERGQKIGLVGPVGSGKTTLFNLILRLYEPPGGAISLEGIDILSIPLEELRTRIASVEQQIFLFSEKVSANISLGVRGDVSDDKIKNAGKAACIHDEVVELPMLYETMLGERGVNLSGGQKQRLALSRALVREPKALLLDDCFSAVDVHVENQIIDILCSGFPALSLCVASHRLSIMPRMDEVWLMVNGELLEKGRHTDLLSTNTLYQALWEKSSRQMERENFNEVVVPGEVIS